MRAMHLLGSDGGVDLQFLYQMRRNALRYREQLPNHKFDDAPDHGSPPLPPN